MEQNQSHQMGELIARLRRERHMTQKDLAAQLGVTDKAVSKWERNLSCPDVALLLPLSDALGITASELLRGERQASEAEEQAVRSALLYSGKSLLERVQQAKRVIFLILSAAFLLAAAVCLLCDYCTAGHLSWSWIVLISLLYALGMALPLLRAEKQVMRKLLLAASAGILPYLGGLSLILRQPMVFWLGGCIALLSLLWLWAVLRLLLRLAPRLRGRKRRTTGIALLLTLPLAWAIQAVCAWLLREPAALAEGWISTLSTVLAAAACFLWDALAARKRGENGERA